MTFLKRNLNASFTRSDHHTLWYSIPDCDLPQPPTCTSFSAEKQQNSNRHIRQIPTFGVQIFVKRCHVRCVCGEGMGFLLCGVLPLQSVSSKKHQEVPRLTTLYTRNCPLYWHSCAFSPNGLMFSWLDTVRDRSNNDRLITCINTTSVVLHCFRRGARLVAYSSGRSILLSGVWMNGIISDVAD